MLWSDAIIPSGPLVGSKTSISTTTERKTSTITTYKTTIPTPMQAWINYSIAGTTPIMHMTATIQMQAHMKPPTGQKSSIGYVVIPYTQGIAKSFKNICGKYGIQAYFKGNTTIKQAFNTPKDQDHKDKKSGVIYSYQCGDIACGEEYIGETSRTLGDRYKKHLKQPSPIHVHIQQTGHTTTSNNFKIIGREDQGLARTIKESIYIRVNSPMLNRNIGKYNLNHIWGRVLF